MQECFVEDLDELDNVLSGLDPIQAGDRAFNRTNSLYNTQLGMQEVTPSEGEP
jgi:hypothetical protein